VELGSIGKWLTVKMSTTSRLARKLIICGVIAVAYVVLFRWLLLDYLYSYQMIGWYTSLIESLNRIGRNNYGNGPHPLEEYQQRADILVLQLIAVLTLGRLIRWILQRKSRVLLLAINAALIPLVLLAFEAYLSTDYMGRRVGSAYYERLNRKANWKLHQATNRHGFTDLARSPRKADGVFRIVVLGDSFLWGDGLATPDDIWSHVLAKKIRERHADTVEVVSWGKNGWSTNSQVAFLTGPGDAYDIDFVVIGFVANDPYIPGISMARREFIWHTIAKPPALFRNVTRLITRQVNSILYSLSYFENWGDRGWENKLYTEENLNAYKKVVRKLGNSLRERDIGFFVMTLPGPAAVLDVPTEKYRLLFRVFDELGVAYLDLLPSFLERFGDYDEQRIRLELWANPVNGHPGRPITEFYANFALRYLETNSILPLP
jgi:hypothetical protein